MIINSLPQYSVSELNSAIGKLLERGFAPNFLLQASISKFQKKKGHLWLTLSDGKSSITAVVWASILQRIDYEPSLDDGVLIIGKLNFWPARASLSVQVIDIKPTISTVLRKFEIVKDKLEKEGLIDISRKRKLPLYPKSIAILTSSPSSALADIKKTAQERWPLARLVIIPIPVQGLAEKSIQSTLISLSKCYSGFDIEAIVIARGGGSREDLAIFDSEKICREIARFPIPVVTGIGHEDDITVADLVADYRSATPTAAMISLLPSRDEQLGECIQKRKRINDYINFIVKQYRQNLKDIELLLQENNLEIKIKSRRLILQQRRLLLNALSPASYLSRGFTIIRNSSGNIVNKVENISYHDELTIQLIDGNVDVQVQFVNPSKGSISE